MRQLLPLCHTAGLPGSLLHPIAPNALGAHLDSAHFPVHGRANGLQVRVPPPFDPVIGVADVVAGNGSLAADTADACHDSVISLEDYLLSGET